MKLLLLLFVSLLISACSTSYQNKQVDGQMMPRMLGQTLDKQDVTLPDLFDADSTLLLVGYKHDSQFDIDRWLIGLDMTQTQVDAYEIPAIQGMFPRMFKTQINDSMRAGIPKELWKGVITLYEDGETMQAFTGNENAKNARIILIDRSGKVLYFYDRGFSVPALNQLRSVIL